MTAGRIGRVPAVIALLKRAKRPMSAREIAATFRDQGDEHCAEKTIAETLRNIVKTKPDVGIRRAARRGFYVYVKEYDVPITATKNRSDELSQRAPSARVREIREEREGNVQWPTNDAITSGDPALKDAQVVLPSGAGPNEPIDYAAQARHPGSRLSDHAASCSMIKGDSLTCTCGAYTRHHREAVAAEAAMPPGRYVVREATAIEVGHDPLCATVRAASLNCTCGRAVVNSLQPKVTMDTSWASAHPFPFTHIRIVRTLADGRVLFTDDPTGKAWVAKEV